MGMAASRVRMLMPEAAVHEYDLAPSCKHEVRISRQVFAVQPEAESHSMN